MNIILKGMRLSTMYFNLKTLTTELHKHEQCNLLKGEQLLFAV